MNSSHSISSQINSAVVCFLLLLLPDCVCACVSVHPVCMLIYRPVYCTLTYMLRMIIYIYPHVQVCVLRDDGFLIAEVVPLLLTVYDQQTHTDTHTYTQIDTELSESWMIVDCSLLQIEQ